MNDRISERAGCPFFQNISRNKKMVGVECESLDVNLGFDTSHFIRLKNYQELDDYTDIFCCDMYETCPYYKALMETKYKEFK